MNKTEFLQQVSGAAWSMHRYASPDDIHSAIDTIALLIEKGGCPDSFFSDFRGAGSYKEAWQIGGLCIKFATGGDTIEREITAYAQALDRGIQHIFCPTVFCKLPEDVTIILSEMDEESVYPEDPRYDTADDRGCIGSRFAHPIAAYIVIQPIAGLMDDLTCPNTPGACLDNPLKLQDGTTLSPEEYLIIDAPLEWRESIVTTYGDHGYRDLVWALRRMYIEDLHVGNVGWLGDLPVIIDWMSYHPYGTDL